MRASFLMYTSALEGREKIYLKVSDLLILVSKSPHKMGTFSFCLTLVLGFTAPILGFHSRRFWTQDPTQVWLFQHGLGCLPESIGLGLRQVEVPRVARATGSLELTDASAAFLLCCTTLTSQLSLTSPDHCSKLTSSINLQAPMTV